jgi:hypothetical protein
MSLRAFVKEVYAPGLHLAYATAWLLSLDAALAVAHGREWSFEGRHVLGTLTIFLVLFYLRAVDELKDVDYDRVHNPDRPVARGAITRAQVFRLMGGTAAIVLAANAFLSWRLGAILLADMAWALLLMFIERRSRVIRDGMLVNLLVTYPVNVALSVYGYELFLLRHGLGWNLQGVLVILAFALAFLNYEVSRKTAWPPLATPGERLYSAPLGGWGAIVFALACATGATLLLLTVLLSQKGARATLILAPLLPAVWGATRFVRERRERVKLTKYGLRFLFLFYVLALVEALA